MLAGACWLPLVAIQMRMKAMLEAQARGLAFDEAACKRLFRWLFVLGWPAFGGLVVRILAHGRQAPMVARVLIIGGYGNFGSYIARSLASDAQVRPQGWGRSAAKAPAFLTSLPPLRRAEAPADL